MLRLVCPLCGLATPVSERSHCPDCRAGLEVHYSDFRQRIRGLAWPPDLSLPLAERYAAFLPDSARAVPSLGEGNTMLFEAPEFGARAGCASLHLQHEGLNPLGSFKDRGTLVALGHALATGHRVVGTVSSGNMAASVAAYAARAGVPAVVLVSDGVPLAKLRAVGVYRPLLLRVRREHERLYEDSVELGRALGIHFLNSDHPFRLEGQKTVAMDICARLAAEPPTCIVVPLSSGGHLLSICKGLRGLVGAGVIDSAPKVVGVQPAGCAPIWDAFTKGLAAVTRVEAPSTIAGSIRNPFPPGGARVLAALRQQNPDIEVSVTVVTDDEMVATQRELAEHEGLWVQPDAAATVAALPALVAEGVVAATDRVVCVLTGAGHRDPDTPSAPSMVGDVVEFASVEERIEHFLRTGATAPRDPAPASI